ncbi:MAG: YdcF family protein [Eggerthellaceae bacterium]|nr:YdcF family protein [Eggerthellaceae bacterium]
MADVQTDNHPKQLKRIWRRFLLLVPLVVVLALSCGIYIKSVSDTYTAIGWIQYDEEEFQANTLELTTPGVVEVETIDRTGLGYVRIVFRAVADGTTVAMFVSDQTREIWPLEVRDGSIIEGGINFTGWESINISLCIFLAAAVILFATALRRLHRRCWYGYEMVACAGGLLFCLFQLGLFVGILFLGGEPTFRSFLQTVSFTAEYFVLVSFIPMALIAVFLLVSNISLIRHEGFRPANLLGIAFGVVWAIANVLLFVFGSSWYGLDAPLRVMEYINSLLIVAIAFGECLLVATMLCAYLASHHEPKHGVDYLVILGCGIRSDGTPFPLLAQRIDRAVSFDAQRIESGDEPVVFVCSGGQGPDEPMSEAQSMSNYLQGKGIPQKRIVLEGRSNTTNENMAFSREAIEAHAQCDANEKRVGFSTTNYHVFRGYVCAHKAGMAVEGMGSKTRYYFWPNAFLREFAGLLVWQWKTIVQTYLIIAIIHLYVAYVLAVL